MDQPAQHGPARAGLPQQGHGIVGQGGPVRFPAKPGQGRARAHGKNVPVAQRDLGAQVGQLPGHLQPGGQALAGHGHDPADNPGRQGDQTQVLVQGSRPAKQGVGQKTADHRAVHHHRRGQHGRLLTGNLRHARRIGQDGSGPAP